MLNNILLENEWVDQAIKEEIKKYMEANENENMPVQTLWDAAKAVLRGKYIAIQGLSQETRKTPNTKSNSTPKGNRSRAAKTPKPNRRREIIKVRAEINNIESKKTVEQITETKSWFFEKINKIDKPLARVLKKKREDPNR